MRYRGFERDGILGSGVGARLGMIAEEIAALGRVGRLIDIGADHAMLPCWLAENGICDTCLATDASRAPLERARAAVESAGLARKVELRLGDGFAAVGISECEGAVAVIAGMGGKAIAGIVARAGEAARLCRLLALQPMNDHGALRRALIGSGYGIMRERVAIDGGRVYAALFCAWNGFACNGVRSDYSAADYAVGKGAQIGSPEARLKMLRLGRLIAANRRDGLLSAARRGNGPRPACIGGVSDGLKELTSLQEAIVDIDARIAELQRQQADCT